MLHLDCPHSDLSAADKNADFHAHEIAATELAVGRQVEQRPISQSAALTEVEADFPYLLWFQRTLRPDGPSSIPDWAFCGRGFSCDISMMLLQRPEWPPEERLSA
ncbi:hypothetical protein [Sphingobium sp. CFD-2]|uniref:hypothetical protein n=1 Tax=Sphingobium sp. CFD-2 TaxID=2878542 RepID=UPI00214B2022|nr:hypothetical protein [Sphingobium sp. CFD-2]